jgi:glutaredoxin-like protein NrdH
MLTVYSTRNCSACRLTKTVLERAGAPFQVVDLEAAPEKAEELRAAGHQALPVVDMEGEQWSGFQLDRLREAIAYFEGEGQ